MDPYLRSVDRLIWENEPDMAGARDAHDLLASNPIEALKKLRLLAERGSRMSMVYLGDAHEKGIGTKPSLLQAQIWYERAAQGGSVFGSYKLGRYYFKLKNYEKAAEALKIGASREYMPCIIQLGRMHLRGQGVEKDIGKALDCLERASKHNYAFAKHDLAALLIRGVRGPAQRLRGILLYFGGLKDLFIATMIEKSDERLR
jgi:TPR repeat protein